MKPECDISYGEEEVAARGGTSMNFGCPFYRSCSCGSIFSIPVTERIIRTMVCAPFALQIEKSKPRGKHYREDQRWV